MRIAVAIGVPRAAIAGSRLAVRELRDGAPARELEGQVEVAVEGDFLTVNGEPTDAAGVIVESRGGPLRFGSVALEGDVEVRRGEGGLDVVDALPLEAYVAAVLGGEMPSWFPVEALKAQAVAARTYAVQKKLEAVSEGKAWHLGSTVLDQVFGGAARADARTRDAAEATRGEVLVYDHQPIEAYFHSACGGRTEDGADALGRDLPYLRSVKDPYCAAAPKSSWSAFVPAEELARAARLPGAATEAKVVERTRTGRAARVEIASRGRRARLTAVELRQRLGYDRLPSLAFAIVKRGGSFRFDGRGSGHGAGLCQWGAAGMAKAGKTYREILARYYTGAELVRMY